MKAGAWRKICLHPFARANLTG